MFDKNGFHGVTVSEIVAQTGTSKGGFYHHFYSKDELLFVIHDTFITYALEQAMIANKTYFVPTQKLQTIVKEFVKTFDLYKPYISVFYQEDIYLKYEYEWRIREKRDSFKQIIIEVLKEGQETGEFRDRIPVDMTAMAILGMVNWTYKWYQPSGAMSIDDIGSVYVDLILHAVLKPDSLTESTYQDLLLASVKKDLDG
ncbi:TetR/AcrR family transcriptional regulator [Barrientosiimonas marina]